MTPAQATQHRVGTVRVECRGKAQDLKHNQVWMFMSFKSDKIVIDNAELRERQDSDKRVLCSSGL